MNSRNENKLALWARELGYSNEYLVHVLQAKLLKETNKKRRRAIKRSIKFAERWRYESRQPGIAVQTCWDDDSPLERSGVKELKLDGTDVMQALDAGDNNNV